MNLKITIEQGHAMGNMELALEFEFLHFVLVLGREVETSRRRGGMLTKGNAKNANEARALQGELEGVFRKRSWMETNAKTGRW